MSERCIIDFSAYKTKNTLIIQKKFPAFFRANRASKVGISVVAIWSEMLYNVNRLPKKTYSFSLNKLINNFFSSFGVFNLALISFFRPRIDIVGKGNFLHV